MSTPAVRFDQRLSNDDLVDFEPESRFREFHNGSTDEFRLGHQCRAVGILLSVIVVLNLLQTESCRQGSQNGRIFSQRTL